MRTERKGDMKVKMQLNTVNLGRMQENQTMRVEILQKLQIYVYVLKYVTLIMSNL